MHAPLTASERRLLDLEPPPTEDQLTEATRAILGLHQAILGRAADASADVAYGITCVAAAILLAACVSLVQRMSFADLRLAYQPLPGQYANRRALAAASLGVLAYYVAAAAVLELLFSTRGCLRRPPTPPAPTPFSPPRARPRRHLLAPFSPLPSRPPASQTLSRRPGRPAHSTIHCT